MSTKVRATDPTYIDDTLVELLTHALFYLDGHTSWYFLTYPDTGGINIEYLSYWAIRNAWDALDLRQRGYKYEEACTLLGKRWDCGSSNACMEPVNK